VALIEQLDAYEWLLPNYREPPCLQCEGRGCECCGGTGRGAPVFSRTDAIRRMQEVIGHEPCFGPLGKFSRNGHKLSTPNECEKPTCPFRRPCTGLHIRERYAADRIREDSIELLSRIFLNARAIERHTRQLSPFRTELVRLIEQWTDDTPQVAVLGAFSAGKSTLLNRLVERSLLPTARTPTTAVVTSIRYGDRAHGVLYFRNVTRVTLLSKDAHSPDPTVMSALQEWLRHPRKYGVRSIAEVDDSGKAVTVSRRAVLKALELLVQDDSERLTPRDESPRSVVGTFRRVIRQIKPPTQQLARTFEVRFADRPAFDVDLDTEEGIAEFGQHLTEPALALSLRRAVCVLPDQRLQTLNFLDTAGLCSPVGFHKDVTAELLKRRPDKILVLLDSRRLDSPTNREALKVLRRFISVPDDYRQVTFALTFWDLALRTHMLEDSDPELDFYDHDVRSEADRRLASWRRRDLAELLSTSVGVPCPREPVVFTLGLGDNAPQEMRRGIDALWRHLVNECRGWVGIEMWAERWRAARSHASSLVELLSETICEVEQARSDALTATNFDAEVSRIKKQSDQIRAAVDRAKGALFEIVQAQKERMLAEVNSLNSKSTLLSYLDTGYWESANTALNVLQLESKRQRQALLELHRGARALSVISLDRKLLGLEDSVRKQARGEVSGFLYGLKSIWDFLLGSVVELNEGNRAAVREILRSQVQDTMDILDSAVEEWTEQAERVCEQALAEYEERLESLSARQRDVVKYIEGLDRKLRFLENCQAPVYHLHTRIEEFADDLSAVRSRIAASRQPDFKAVLYTDEGMIAFRKAREHDLLLLYNLNKSPWRRLEITFDGRSKHFLPAFRGKTGKRVVFREDNGIGGGRGHYVIAPDGAIRFELRLSTLEGIFRFPRYSPYNARNKRGR